MTAPAYLEGQFEFEIETRDRILVAFDEAQGDLLAFVRSMLAAQYQNTGIAVTADDARAVLAELERHGVALPANRNFLGALFKAPGWRAVGSRKSRSPGRHASRILAWEHREPAEAR
jgi:hypothetical protein